MMKRISLISAAFILVLSINVLYADDGNGEVPKTVSISGTVTDQYTKEALAGALVKVEGTDIETYTDLEGKFSITGIVPDTYKVKCSMISYNDKEEEVELEKTTNELEIKLDNLSIK
jgi:hypothetical protein